MYVAVKGGERAIANAHALLAKQGRGDTRLPRIEQAAVAAQLGVLVARVMTEGSLYDPELAARAILQAQGDVLEAITLVRSYRTTLPRFGYTLPVDTAGLPPQRRISATFKDLPGGQQLGATFDYTHRLLPSVTPAAGDRYASGPQTDDADGPRTGDANGPRTGDAGGPRTGAETGQRAEMPRVLSLLGAGALVEPDGGDDREPRRPHARTDGLPGRAGRLQALARGDEGFLLGLAYSSQRGWGNTHPFAGEIRLGEVAVEFVPDELGFAIEIGRGRR